MRKPANISCLACYRSSTRKPLCAIKQPSDRNLPKQTNYRAKNTKFNSTQTAFVGADKRNNQFKGQTSEYSLPFSALKLVKPLITGIASVQEDENDPKCQTTLIQMSLTLRCSPIMLWRSLMIIRETSWAVITRSLRNPSSGQ